MSIRFHHSGFAAVATACYVFVLAGCGGSPVTANRDNVEAMRTYFESGSGGGGATAGIELQEPTGFADLTGTFTVSGNVPNLGNAAVSGADAGYCGTSPRQSIVVNNGKLANVLIYLDMKIPSNEKWEHADYLTAKDATLTGENAFDQKKCVFLSHVFAMRSTQTVAILNSDTVGHNTNVAGPAGVKSINPTMPPGAEVLYNPGGQASSPFSVSCAVHPWMGAYMISRDNPYFAVTDENGSFEIKHVPAGVELRFRVWQEHLKFVSVPVKVNGETTSWKKGRTELTLTKDTPMQFDVEIDAAAFN